jgi:hypothetical protein
MARVVRRAVLQCLGARVPMNHRVEGSVRDLRLSIALDTFGSHRLS